MKRSNTPSLPDPLPLFQVEDRAYHPGEAEEAAGNMARKVKRILRKSNREAIHDFDDAMMQKRVRAAVDFMPKIMERYASLPGYKDGNTYELLLDWLTLNLYPCKTYVAVENESHILTGAALWILDQVVPEAGRCRSLFGLLPSDDESFDELNIPNIWDPSYDFELIQSVVSVLLRRNRDTAPPEMVDEYEERSFTSVLAAKNQQHQDTPSRITFDTLMDLIPEEAVKQAVLNYETHFWAWLDRYFSCIDPLNVLNREFISQCDEIAKEFNEERRKLEQFGNTVEEEMRGKKQAPPKKPVMNPLLMNPQQEKPLSVEAFIATMGRGGPSWPSTSLDPKQSAKTDGYIQNAMFRAQRMASLVERHDKLLGKQDAIAGEKVEISYDFTHHGNLTKSNEKKFSVDISNKAEPIAYHNPFEICFALLWLIEHDSDLPWLYGPSVGMMTDASESLPWGIYEYDELEDAVWLRQPEDYEDDEQLSFVDTERRLKPVKPLLIPDWYERRYPARDEVFDFDRNLAQIIYEETGCLMPRDLHRYDKRSQALKEYGVPTREHIPLTYIMTALSHASRQRKALNLSDDWLHRMLDNEENDEIEDDGGEQQALTAEELSEQLKTATDEIKRLRSALHESEKTSRELRKELTVTHDAAQMDHRELADLRELVFNQENEVEQQGEDESADTDTFPYEVNRETVVFGGHETWLKAIRQMLTGKIRFVDKDLVFDINIIRHADILWIQTNALSHKQYYRIIDTARQFKKPVRYFTYSSAARGARQVMEADVKG